VKSVILLLAVVLILVAAPDTRASSDAFGLAWGVSLPTGDTGDYISRVSFRGASAEWRHFFRMNSAWGFNVGWNVFNQDSSGTLVLGDLTVTGRAWRYVNAVPVYAGYFHYLSSERGGMRPFLGLNGGTAWIGRRSELGLLTIDERNWHVALCPEVGAVLPYDFFLGFVTLRYHYAFSAGDADAQQWLELRIGFGLD